MKYLKLFNTKEEYENKKSSLSKPCVTYDKTEIHYLKVESKPKNTGVLDPEYGYN